MQIASFFPHYFFVSSLITIEGRIWANCIHIIIPFLLETRKWIHLGHSFSYFYNRLCSVYQS